MPNDPEQVIYVWADALVNYISVVGVEGWEEHPADIHAVGKEISAIPCDDLAGDAYVRGIAVARADHRQRDFLR